MKDNLRKVPRAVVMLGLVSLFTDISSEMIFPLIPVFVSALGSGAIILGIIEGIAETTASVLKLVSGVLSDRAGKRKLFVVTGYAISTFVRPLTATVSSAWQIIFVRMFDRVGKGIRTSPRDALIASSVDENMRGKAFGFERSMDHIGAVAGPVIAIITLFLIFSFTGITSALTALRWTFLMALIPGLLALATLLIFVKEPSESVGEKKKFEFSLRNTDKNFRNYLLVMILFTLGNSSDAFLLFRIEETITKSGAVVRFVENIGPLNKIVSSFSGDIRNSIINILFLPLVWSFFHIIKASLSTPLSSLSDCIGRKKVINSGWCVYAFVYLSFAFIVFLPSSAQIAATFILFAIYALFYAFTEGVEKAFVADLVSPRQRGTAYGLFNFSIGLGALPASVIFGFLYSYFDRKFPGYGGTVAFGFGGIIAIISIILLTLTVKESRQKSE
jgi:MFS family permease